VTLTTVLRVASAPTAVPESTGLIPKFTSQGPPLDPPVCSEPMTVLFEALPSTKPYESVRCISEPPVEGHRITQLRQLR
jgi:hypothetical protein